MNVDRPLGVIRSFMAKTTVPEWLLLQRAFVRHLLALILVVGFLTLVTLALVGSVKVMDATVTSFLGVALGFISAKLDYVVKFYFGKAPEDPGFLDKTKPTAEDDPERAV